MNRTFARRLALGVGLALAVAGGASAQPVTEAPNWAISAKSPISTPITSAGASGSFTPLAGRPFHVQLTGTASAVCYLERQLDGTNWVPISATAAGSTTLLYNWTYASSSISEDIVESQTNVPYRVDCGVLLGSYTSGSLTVRISQ